MQSTLYEYLAKNKLDFEQLIVLDEKEKYQTRDIFSFFDIKAFALPDIRIFNKGDMRVFIDEFYEFNLTLRDYYSHSGKKVLITPVYTTFIPFLTKQLFDTHKLEFASEINYEELKDTLYRWGYSFVDIVESKAEVSFRADIIDIFPIDSDGPYRISLFDNEIDSIKKYDKITQRTYGDEIELVNINSALFALNKTQFNDISQKVEDFESDILIKDITSLGIWFLDDLACNSILNFKSKLLNKDIQKEIEYIYQIEENIDIQKSSYESLSVLPKAKVFADLPPINDYSSIININKNKKITLLSASDILIKQFELEDLKDNYSLVIRDEIICISSPDEMIITVFRKSKKSKKAKNNTIVLDELKKNDLVVHDTYGIGMFNGIEHAKVLGHYKDYVCILYQNQDKLLLPIENIDIIDRYIADSSKAPNLDKLGKGSFAKLKQKAKAKLFEIADNIVQIAAKRELVLGKKVLIDNKLLDDFQKEANFEYTQDQLSSVESIIEDIASGKVMDRLLVGDVGFGKTEVALNAIFACAINNFQILFVVPTTLLCNQHYLGIKQRLEKFNIKVAHINRFVSAKEKKQIYSDFENGDISVVVGTHAIFNIKPKNLSLVIVDEEHKFGVKQKENLKNITKDVHILSMSATPIPRSLNLALSHIKTISYLTTPPLERLPVRTYVREYSDSLFKEAISRELRRGGQIFYLHNHISTIDKKADYIKEIMPSLRCLTLHSKVSSSFMEEGILDFSQGKYDILICTSIIESGIHIPNANTIIIDNADRFGLADLHQLRGRVGRASREGFCYYLVEDKEEVTQQAKKRLSALEVHSSLGSGSLIARQDLEIRGAGNMLGEVQSGHINGIGYSLYVKMLEDALNVLSNKQEQKEEKNIDIKLSVDKYISSDLIAEDRLRLDIYRRLSQCKDIMEVFDIQSEIEDRFGSLDEKSELFLDVIKIKILALKQDIKLITSYEKNISIEHNNKTSITLEAKEHEDREIIDEVMRYLKKNK